MAENVLELTDDNFDAEIEQDGGVALVDFWAEWCPPCQMIAPIIEELADTYQGKAKIGKVDVDAGRAVASQFGITAIPTLIVFKGGEAVKRFTGVTQKDELQAAIDAALE